MSRIQEKDWCAYWRPHQYVDSLNFSMQVQQDPSVGPSMDVKRNCSLTAPFHDLRGIPCCLFVAFLVASLRHFLVATRQGMLCTLDGATGSLLQLSCKEYWLWNLEYFGTLEHNSLNLTPRTLTCPLKRDHFKNQNEIWSSNHHFSGGKLLVFRRVPCWFWGVLSSPMVFSWFCRRFHVIFFLDCSWCWSSPGTFARLNSPSPVLRCREASDVLDYAGGPKVIL